MNKLGETYLMIYLRPSILTACLWFLQLLALDEPRLLLISSVCLSILFLASGGKFSELAVVNSLFLLPLPFQALLPGIPNVTIAVTVLGLWIVTQLYSALANLGISKLIHFNRWWLFWGVLFSLFLAFSVDLSSATALYLINHWALAVCGLAAGLLYAQQNSPADIKEIIRVFIISLCTVTLIWALLILFAPVADLLDTRRMLFPSQQMIFLIPLGFAGAYWLSKKLEAQTIALGSVMFFGILLSGFRSSLFVAAVLIFCASLLPRVNSGKRLVTFFRWSMMIVAGTGLYLIYNWLPRLTNLAGGTSPNPLPSGLLRRPVEGDNSLRENERFDIWIFYLSKFWETPITGFSGDGASLVSAAPGQNHPHNFWINLLIEFGLVGFFLAVLPLIVAIVWVLQLGAHRGKTFMLLSVASLGILLSVGQFFTPSFPWLWLFFGLCMPQLNRWRDSKPVAPE